MAIIRFSDLKSDVRTVVERVISFYEGFGGLEFSNV
jgi:hypothetical protein